MTVLQHPELSVRLVSLSVISILVAASPSHGQIVPLGDAFTVNDGTAGRQTAPAAACDDAGNFVVVWASDSIDASAGGIVARRFDAEGAALTSDFQVDTATAGRQQRPLVNAHPAGSVFVVAWTDYYAGRDGDRSAAVGRAYDDAGALSADDIQVNVYTTGFQLPGAVLFLEGTAGSPSNSTTGRISTDVGFDNVVIYDGANAADPGRGVTGRRFDAGGPGGVSEAEFAINTYTTGTQNDSGACADANGNFVVVWTSNGQDGNSFGVFGQRFDSAANRVGTEFQVNTYATGAQRTGEVCCAADGSFTVTWCDEEGLDGDSHAVLARSYDFTGEPRSEDPFVVNSYTTFSQNDPAIDCDASGRSVISWSNGRGGVSVRELSAEGVPLGTELVATGAVGGTRTAPTIALAETGTFVVAWQERDVDGDSDGVRARRFALASGPSTTTTTSTSTTATLPIVTSTSSTLPAPTTTSTTTLAPTTTTTLPAPTTTTTLAVPTTTTLPTPTTTTTLPAPTTTTTTSTLPEPARCGQPVSTGAQPVASDCLFILRVASGLATCTPDCICAPSGSLPVTATDALVCLDATTNPGVELRCPCAF